MNKPRVLVIGGGPSPEREIALLSSHEVFSALNKTKYDIEFYNWDGTTTWLQDNLKRFDVVLPILHGVGGEDGTIQKILEAAKVPFLGSDSVVSELCFNKQKTIEKCNSMAIPTPAGSLVTFAEYKAHPLASQPHVLKPNNSGSSIDTYIIDDPASAAHRQIEGSFEKYGTMLLEELVRGVEITVPLLDGATLPTIEIQPPKDGTFDYENKYNGKTRELCPPVNITKKLQQIANNYAVKIYQTFNIRHIARVDMIVTDDKIYILEVNTMPGLTSQSLFPKAAAEAGVPFIDLVDRFVQLVSAPR